MRIIISSYTDLGNPETPRGLEAEFLALELLRRGHKTKVLCRGISRKRQIHLPRKDIIRPIPFGNALPRFFSGIYTYVSRRFPARVISQNRLFDPLGRKHIRDADLLLCCHAGLLEQQREAKRRGIPVFIIAIIGHPDYVAKLMEEEYAKYGLSYAATEYRDLKKFESPVSYLEADNIFAKSDYNKRTLAESGVPLEKIYAIPIGGFADTTRFCPPAMRPAKFRVAYVGMISFWKGIHYLLEAWEQLALPNAELLLCGTPEKAFKEKFGRFWHTPSIRFLGHVDPLPFLQQSSVFCFPSLSEGCPQAIIEAMACGLPVIATENSGSLARNGKEGFVVPIRDSGALAAKIRFFYENPRPARQMGAAAARRAKEFSIERYSERFAGSIEDAYVKLGRREKIGR